MGAGRLRWWLSGSLESRREAHQQALEAEFDRDQSFVSWRLAPPSIMDLLSVNAADLAYWVTEPFIVEGYMMICARHGIYGKVGRGDICGACRIDEERRVA